MRRLNSYYTSTIRGSSRTEPSYKGIKIDLWVAEKYLRVLLLLNATRRRHRPRYLHPSRRTSGLSFDMDYLRPGSSQKQSARTWRCGSISFVSVICTIERTLNERWRLPRYLGLQVGEILLPGYVHRTYGFTQPGTHDTLSFVTPLSAQHWHRWGNR